MSTNSVRPYFGDHLYIPGIPDRDAVEYFADGCLSFPGHLSENMRVEVIREGNDFDVRYSNHGFLDQLFTNIITAVARDDIENPSCFDSAIMIPAYLAVGATYTITCILAKPFEFIGKCLKNSALEKNPQAKDYNDLAASHLQYLQERDASLGGIEILKPELERKLAQVELLEKIYSLVLDSIKSHPERFSRAKFGDIPLIIKPMLNNDETDDYEILGPIPVILPTTRNKLFQLIESQKRISDHLEKEFLQKLPLFQMEDEKFKSSIKPFLRNEHTHLGAT